MTENLSVREAETFAKTKTPKTSAAAGTRLPNSLPDASVLEAQNQLAEYLNTTVSVQKTSKRGKIIIEFATIEDLKRIYDLIGP